ncbi:hypothetical protein KIN20_025970 [Parelaphostrongylus tenuis]|uniref:Uncharacterized protein n=1 Tax=Parelaphostrongylus tenuis TaxID=148309 RepID=A0AAD5QXU9_PARTN|nr:hypothetical protein KIN20_025970 [Parelaphostrongylus tenuis]
MTVECIHDVLVWSSDVHMRVTVYDRPFTFRNTATRTPQPTSNAVHKDKISASRGSTWRAAACILPLGTQGINKDYQRKSTSLFICSRSILTYAD